MIEWLRRLLCKHEIFLEDLKRHDYETDGFRLVEATCNHCGKRLKAPYGLALNVKITRRPKA